tara:strand:- start:123 stop:1283 length:1161 start_codon:yes stop_codon:yes gene_type:complete
VATTTVDLAIDRPETNDLGDLVRGYYTMMRMLGFDLGLTAQRELSPSRGAFWFTSFIAERKQTNPKHFPPNQQFDYRDPALVLKDFAFEPDSPYREAFGHSESMAVAAKKIIAVRNKWFHFGDDPTLEDLAESAQYVRTFAQEANLGCLGQVVALLTRLQRIKTGRHQPKLAGQSSPPPPAAAPVPVPSEPSSTSVAQREAAEDLDSVEDVSPAKIEVPADTPRPRIGGVWADTIPDSRYKITRTGDIVDPDTFASLRTRVGDGFALKARQWLAVPPRGNEVWVAEDGAVGGWINEYPRLLGYIGEEPAGESARGFYIPHYYEVQGDTIRDLDSGAMLTSEVAARVEDGALLRVTTYGDVLLINDATGLERLTTVTSDEWFPGHLS